MTTATFTVGDRVFVDDPHTPGVWTIAQKLPKNYRLTQGEAPRVRTIKSAPELMRPVEGDVAAEAANWTTAPNGAQVIEIPLESPLTIGELVKLRGHEDVFVVVRETRAGYHVVKLGGDGGRYYGPLMSALLTPIKIEWTVL